MSSSNDTADAKGSCNLERERTLRRSIKSKLADRNGSEQSYSALLKEKIIVCADTSEAIDSVNFTLGDGRRVDSFGRLLKVLKMFVHWKLKLCQNFSHEMTIFDMNVGTFSCGFFNKSSINKFLSVINGVKKSPSDAPANFTAFFHMLHDKLHWPPPSTSDYICRVICIYTRSSESPVIEIDEKVRRVLDHPNVYCDVIYVHEYPDEFNNVQKIFDALCKLDSGRSLIMEVGSNVTRLHEAFAKLVAHPFLRPKDVNIDE